jgi:hypothetical protein
VVFKPDDERRRSEWAADALGLPKTSGASSSAGPSSKSAENGEAGAHWTDVGQPVRAEAHAPARHDRLHAALALT